MSHFTTEGGMQSILVRICSTTPAVIMLPWLLTLSKLYSCYYDYSRCHLSSLLHADQSFSSHCTNPSPVMHVAVVCVCVCACVRVLVYVCMCERKREKKRECVCMCACMWVCACMHVCVHACVCTHIVPVSYNHATMTTHTVLVSCNSKL